MNASQFYIFTNSFRVLFKIIGLALTKKKNNNPLTIATYHSVGQNQQIELDIPLELFKKQIRYFIKNYEIISFDEAINKIENDYFTDNWDGKKKFLVITFDDGYDNFYLDVLPLIRKMKIPVMLFPALEFIDNPEKIPLKSSVGKWKSFSPLTENQLLEINKSELVSIGCHSYQHLDYSSLHEKEIEEQIEISQRKRSSLNILKCNTFCFPMGKYSDGAVNILLKYYNYLLRGTGFVNVHKFDPLFIPRIPILRSDGFFWFKLRIKGHLLEDLNIISGIIKRLGF